MISDVIIVRLRENAAGIEEIIKRLNESLEENDYRYYNPTEDDRTTLEDLDDYATFIFIAFKYNDSGITEGFLGEASKTGTGKQANIVYKIMAKLKEGPTLSNIEHLANLRFEKDFKKGRYLYHEKYKNLITQVEDIIYNEDERAPFVGKYKMIDTEGNLHPLAQKNEYCIREYCEEGTTADTSQFQLDCERIIQSKAFRRLVDKAQIFSTNKGDHYRTRMTHTQIVSRIGRTISEALHMNSLLVEAIALGHDIGHTPFGHQGERTLDSILNGSGCDIIKDIAEVNAHSPIGRFKHNYQSIRIAARIEPQYPHLSGMNLSYQTLEGMLKHTSMKKEQYRIGDFVDLNEEQIYYDIEFCTTIEGQIVAIADEIAQRGHDLDDAFSSCALSFKDFNEYLTSTRQSNLSQMVNKVEEHLEECKSKHIIISNEREYRINAIVSLIVDSLVDDVINNSRHKIEAYSVTQFKSDGNRVLNNLVDFSDEGSLLNRFLDTIIKDKVINNPEVSLFDYNATQTIEGLFRAYYNNPRLLHKGTKRKLYADLRKETRCIIDFETGNADDIKREFECITRGDLGSMEADMKKEYCLKRRLLVRRICDYISGMTDTYAQTEYNKIVKCL